MRYLLFDADMTFWDFHATEHTALVKILAHYDLAFTPATFAAYEKGNKWCWKQFEEGLMTLETLEPTRWQLFFNEMGMDNDAEEAAEYFGRMLAENGVMLPGAREFLDALQGEKMSLITNGISRIQRQRLRDTDTEKYFEHLFISQEMGVNKPQKEFFDFVLSTLALPPERCLVIGDSENSDIRGANNAGIDSIYLNFSGRVSEMATWSASSYDELLSLIRSID